MKINQRQHVSKDKKVKINSLENKLVSSLLQYHMVKLDGAFV